MLNVSKLTIHFKDSKTKFVLEDVLIDESMTTLTVHNDHQRFSVIPLANLSHYDVELA